MECLSAANFRLLHDFVAATYSWLRYICIILIAKNEFCIVKIRIAGKDYA